MAWFKYDENALVIIRQVIWKENVTPRRWQLIITGQKTIYLVVDFLIIESPQLRPYSGWVTQLIPPLLGLNGLESYGHSSPKVIQTCLKSSDSLHLT